MLIIVYWVNSCTFLASKALSWTNSTEKRLNSCELFYVCCFSYMIMLIKFYYQMNWTKSLNNIAKNTKCSISVFKKCQYSTFRTEQNLLASLQVDTGCGPARLFQRAGYVSNCFLDAIRSRVKSEWSVKLPCGLSSNIVQKKYCTKNDQDLSSNFGWKIRKENVMKRV